MRAEQHQEIVHLLEQGKANVCLIGGRYPRPVPGCRDTFLVQAMGRIKQEESGAGIRWSNVGWYACGCGDRASDLDMCKITDQGVIPIRALTHKPSGSHSEKM